MILIASGSSVELGATAFNAVLLGILIIVHLIEHNKKGR